MLLIFFCLFINNNLYSKSTFSGERLKSACLEYIQDKVGTDAEISISQKINTQNFEEDGITAKCLGDEKSFRGNGYVTIEFEKDGQLKRRVEVPVRVKIFKNVPNASHALMRGDVIAKEDINVIKTDVTYYKDYELLNETELIGKKVKQNVSERTLFTKMNVYDDNMIKRGDKVTIIVQSGAVRITASGEALQDAAIGKPIIVKRDGSQEKLQGKVNEDGTVIISAN
jgi:flagella basal body P-ring formation protein FlgA